VIAHLRDQYYREWRGKPATTVTRLSQLITDNPAQRIPAVSDVTGGEDYRPGTVRPAGRPVNQQTSRTHEPMNCGG
jgi:hypothetical protein